MNGSWPTSCWHRVQPVSAIGTTASVCLCLGVCGEVWWESNLALFLPGRSILARVLDTGMQASWLVPVFVALGFRLWFFSGVLFLAPPSRLDHASCGKKLRSLPAATIYVFVFGNCAAPSRESVCDWFAPVLARAAEGKNPLRHHGAATRQSGRQA